MCHIVRIDSLQSKTVVQLLQLSKRSKNVVYVFFKQDGTERKGKEEMTFACHMASLPRHPGA